MFTLEERLWAKVDKQAIGCWLWRASRTIKGYGCFWDGERLTLAHRFVYELLVGPIPSKLQIDHLCQNPPCVNINHMEVVTSRVNTLRGNGASAQAHRRTECPRGHPYDRQKPNGDRFCGRCRVEQSTRSNARRAAFIATCYGESNVPAST